MLFLAFILRLVWLTFLYLLLAAFPCYRSSEPVNGSPAKTVSIFETFAAATRGCNFSCVANFSLPKYSICLHFCWSDSLFSNSSIYFSRLIISWLFFVLFLTLLVFKCLNLWSYYPDAQPTSLLCVQQWNYSFIFCVVIYVASLMSIIGCNHAGLWWDWLGDELYWEQIWIAKWWIQWCGIFYFFWQLISRTGPYYLKKPYDVCWNYGGCRYWGRKRRE